MTRLLFVLILSAILSPSTFAATSAGTRSNVPATPRHELHRYIVEAAQLGRGAYVVEVKGSGEYAITLSANGQTFSDMFTGTGYAVVQTDGLLVVSVAAMDGGASCRILDHTAKVVSRVSGGMAASCTVRQ